MKCQVRPRREKYDRRTVRCSHECRVQRLIAAGSSVAEILAAAPSAEFDLVWGRGYVTGTVFVRMILAGLVRPKNLDRN